MPGVDPGAPLSRTVVVTGLGVVSPFGWGVAAFWAGLRAARSAIGPFDRFDHSGHRTHVAATIDLTAEPSGACRRPRGRLSLADRFAVAAAREAVAGSAIDLERCGGRTGVYFGSTAGGMFEGERYFAALLEATAGRARPPATRRVASHQNNGPGDAVARDLGVGGPVQTVSAACTSGAMAIGDATRAVRRGEVDAAIAGGSDSLCRLIYAGFNALRSVDEGPCRPFRADRAGLSLGEGAAALMLEPLDLALARGARPLAVVAGEASTCDAQHMTAPQAEGSGAAEAIRLALAEARLDPDDIDFVNAHGTGTQRNDAAEGCALATVFGARAAELAVTSTKALVGHPLGSAGASEAVATILGLCAAEVHSMPDLGKPDPAIRLGLVLGRARRLARARHALSTSLAFGGANSALVFSRYGDPGADG